MPIAPLPHPSASRLSAARGIRPMVVRWWLPLLLTSSVLCSAVFLTAPFLHRVYETKGKVRVTVHAVEGIPALGKVPEGALKEVATLAGQNGVTLTSAPTADGGGGGMEVMLAARGAHLDTASAHLQRVADQFTMIVQHRGDEALSGYRAELSKQSDVLAARESGVSQEIDAFRLRHRGVLPDDPNSVTAQFEKLSGRLEDKQQRRNLVVEQLKRLEAYKQQGGASSLASAPPPPLPAATPSAEETAARAGNDPEVLSLGAQLALVNKQLDEQFNTYHRTEQHPYVVDLRKQQGELQKKLESAKQRAAAGQPPPAEALTAPVRTAGDPTLAAAQAVDLQMQSLQAERDTLAADIAGLTAERDRMQKQVDQVLPIRQQFEKLTAQLQAVQKQRQAVDGAIAALTGRFGKAEDAPAEHVVESAGLEMGTGSALPMFPGVTMVFVAAVIVGAGAALGLAFLLARMDRAFHSVGEAGAALEVPVVGAIGEIRTRAQERRHRVWESLGRPVAAVGLVAVMVGSGVLCYRHLADPGFGEQGRVLGGVIGGDATWQARAGGSRVYILYLDMDIHIFNEAAMAHEARVCGYADPWHPGGTAAPELSHYMGSMG